MEKYEFLDTVAGKKARFRYNLCRRIRLSYSERLISKKKGFDVFNDRIILDTIMQMEKVKRKSFKGEIACNIKINSIRKNLPETYYISKNFLDLLNKTWVKSRGKLPSSKLSRVPYVDDNQISYLSVSFSTSEPQELNIELSSFSSFLNDLALALEIKKSNTEDSFDSGIDWDWQYKYWQRNEGQLRKQFGNHKYTHDLKLYKKLRQDNFWSGNKLGVSEIYNILGYKGRVNKYKYRNLGIADPLEKSHLACATVSLCSILNSTYSICLPDPCGRNFTSDVATKLGEFKSKILKKNDFDIPVGVQILYRPFKDNHRKDLDNISREILKCFKGCFVNPSYELFGNKFPQSYKNATPCYEVIRLPYEKQSPGFLILRIFSLFMNLRRSLWDETNLIVFGD